MPRTRSIAATMWSLGDPCTFNSGDVLRRTPDAFMNSNHASRRWYKTWLRRGGQRQERTGIVIGIRFLQHGYVIDGEYSEWNQTGLLEALLIAYDMRRNPVLVMPEDVQRRTDA